MGDPSPPRAWVKERIDRYLPHASSLLILGCGTGSILARLPSWRASRVRLSRSARPISALLPYMVAVSMCRYPVSRANRTGSQAGRIRSRQVPKPTIISTSPDSSTAGTACAYTIRPWLPTYAEARAVGGTAVRWHNDEHSAGS